MSELSTNFQPVATRLDVLDAKLSQEIAHAKTRGFITVIIALILVVLMAFYLGYAYLQFSTVDPQFAIQYAQARIVNYLPEAERQLKQQLHDKEDDLVGAAEKSFRGLPEQTAAQLKTTVLAAVDEHMPDIETRMVAVLKEQMGKAAPSTSTDPEQHFREMLAALSTTADTQIISTYNEYLASSNDFISYLDLLAQNKSLTPRQQLQREVVQSFLVLVKQRESQTSGTQPAHSL